MLRITESCIRDTCQGSQRVYQGYMSRITESCIRDTCQGSQRVYQGYMSRITESVSETNFKNYRECIKDVQVNKLTATRVNELNNVYLRVTKI